MLEQTKNETDMEDDIYGKRDDIQNNLADLSNILIDIQNTIESLGHLCEQNCQENDKLLKVDNEVQLYEIRNQNSKNSKKEEEFMKVDDEEQIYGIRNDNTAQSFAEALNLSSDRRINTDSTISYSSYPGQPTTSCTEGIREKLKKFFTIKKRSLPKIKRFVEINGKIYYEFNGRPLKNVSVLTGEDTNSFEDKKNKRKTQWWTSHDRSKHLNFEEDIYELLPVPRTNLSSTPNLKASTDHYENIFAPELPPRNKPAGLPLKKVPPEVTFEELQKVSYEDNVKPSTKPELYYQNIHEFPIENDVQYENQFHFSDIFPLLPPRSPISVPYQPEFQELDGNLTRNLQYKISLPIILPPPELPPRIKDSLTISNEIQTSSNIIFQYDIFLTIDLTKFNIQTRNDHSDCAHKIKVLFGLPENMQIFKEITSTLLNISESKIDYKISIFLIHLPDSFLTNTVSTTHEPSTNPNFSGRPLPAIPSCSETELKQIDKKRPNHQIYSQLPSVNLPPKKEKEKDEEVHLFLDLPINNFTSTSDLRTNCTTYSKPFTDSSKNLKSSVKTCLNFEISLPPYRPPLPKIIYLHSQSLNSSSTIHSIPHTIQDSKPKTVHYSTPGNILVRSFQALNRLSLFSTQYEPIYQDISNCYEELGYKNLLFTPHTEDQLYGIAGENLYDKIAGGSDFTYEEVQWSLARDKKRMSTKLIFELLWIMVCTGMYMMDVGSDMSLAFRYWSNGENLYCGLTLSLVYLASTVDVLYCIYRKELVARDVIFWARFIIMFLLNIRGISEYTYLLKLEYRSFKMSIDSKVIERNLQRQRARVAVLNSYEGIFEACPQLVLQLYLMLLTWGNHFDVTLIMQTVTVISSLCACGAAFVNMEKGLRLEDYGVYDLSIFGIIVQYLWLSPLTASRLLSVALLLSTAPIWLWSGAVVHITLCAALYWFLNEAVTSPRKVMNACVYGARVFVSPYEPAYVRHLVPALNVVHALQNAAATAAWATSAAPCTTILVIVVCGVNLVTHALGLIFAVVFHKCRRHFYTINNVQYVDYGYAVVQVV